MKILLSAFFVVFGSLVYVNAQSSCVVNDGLKVSQKIEYSVDGTKVTGTFSVISYESDETKTYKFTGTKTGSSMAIKFTGEVPYEKARKPKSIVWTLWKRKLRVPMYGQNYETMKYSDYIAEFEPCAAP